MLNSLAFIVGVALGTFFFGGLWWTIRKGLGSNCPAIWFLSSLMVRTAVVLVGFYFLAPGGWQPMLASVFGFTMARLAVTWISRPTEQIPTVTTESSHAH